MVAIRFIAGGITNWPSFIGNVFRILVGTGNGCIQITEIETKLYCHDNTVPENAVAKTWPNLFFAAGDFGDELGTAGFDDIAKSLKRWVQAAGFEDVREDIKLAPVGDWPTSKHNSGCGTDRE